jgi:hypothetical protein
VTPAVTSWPWRWKTPSSTSATASFPSWDEFFGGGTRKPVVFYLGRCDFIWFHIGKDGEMMDSFMIPAWNMVML